MEVEETAGTGGGTDSSWSCICGKEGEIIGSFGVSCSQHTQKMGRVFPFPYGRMLLLYGTDTFHVQISSLMKLQYCPRAPRE